MSEFDVDFSKILYRCEDEKLHLSGSIQGFGALLLIDFSGILSHVSANIGDFVGETAEALLGRDVSLCDWMPHKALSELGAEEGDTQTTVFSIAGKQCFITLLRSKEGVVVEIEHNEVLAEFYAVQHFQRPLLTVPRDDHALVAHHQSLLEGIRKITGYDRVMLYSFRDDFAGEVLAEAVASGIGSYNGLRFPASDIPEIARNLYMVNSSRSIPDVNAMPVPIISINGDPPDLTFSVLRSVSPVHLQYLRNMAVSASFSVPVRVAGRLWGLVACHHLQAKLVSPEQRMACISLANSYALGLASFIVSQRLQAIDSLDRRTDSLLQALAAYADPLDGVSASGAQLMELLSADGFAMAVQDQVVISGKAPDLDGMGVIDHWFVEQGEAWVAVTDHIQSLFPDQFMIQAVVSGMLAVKARSPQSGWVRFYWFRQQEPEEVAWAGNPNKPMIENAGAIALSPRRSFERWVEIKTGYSRPWTNEERMTAAKFRNTLLRWL